MTSMTSLEQITSSANLYTEQVLTQLKALIGKQKITPESTLSEVMYEAGRQSIVEHVEQRIASLRQAK